MCNESFWIWNDSPAFGSIPKIHLNSSREASLFGAVYQGVRNIDFWYERIFEYIFIPKTIRMNNRICSYQKIIRTNIRIYLYQKKMRIWYERIFLSENIRIYIRISEYSSHLGTNTIHARNKKCNNHTTELSHVPKQIALLGLLYLFVDCSADFCNLTNLMDSLSHWVESLSAILT